MAAQSVASRSRKPASADTEDVVIARAIEVSQWAKLHARLLIVVGVLATILVGGFIYNRMYQAERAERAAADFMVLEQSFVTGVDPAVLSADLERFAGRYDGTVYADEAWVMLGRIRLQQGQPQEAIPVLEEPARRLGRTAIGAQAALLLGAAHEQAGNPAAAIDAYLRVGREARFDFERRQGLEAAAAAHLAADEAAAAAELYRQLVGMTEEGSFERSLYEMRAVEAEQQARSQ